MSRRIDITGERYGRLTVLSYVETRRGGKAFWLCRCDCGNESVVSSCDLRSGHTQSCGCLYRESIGNIRRTHGMTNTRLFGVWMNMIGRCSNTNVSGAKNYVGRGISVCEEWHDFSQFAKWALANGYQDNAKRGACTLDREDNDGDYEPSNCRWVTQKINCRNTRRNIVVEIGGVKKTVAEWAEERGVKPQTARDRIRKGWNPIEAVTAPALPSGMRRAQ